MMQLQLRRGRRLDSGGFKNGWTSRCQVENDPAFERESHGFPCFHARFVAGEAFELDFQGERSVHLVPDEFGTCLHVQHGGNTSNSIPVRQALQSSKVPLVRCPTARPETWTSWS